MRAAFGISYFPDNFGANGGTNERNYPFFQEIDLVAAQAQVPFRSISDGLPAFAPVPLAETLAPPAGFAVFYIPRISTRTRRRCGTSAFSVSWAGTRWRT